MTRLAILVTTYILSFSANAVSDMVADMQKTYSKFTTLDNVKYEARGTVQPVWFTYRKLKNQTIPLSTPYAT